MRIRRICSADSDLKLCQAEALLRFQARGYKTSDLHTALLKANHIDSFTGQSNIGEDMVSLDNEKEDNQHRQGEVVRLITTFSRQEKQVRHIITKHWLILKTDITLSLMLQEVPTITFRRAPSMRDALVKTSTEVLTPRHWLSNRTGFFKCNTCRACKFGVNTHQYTEAFGLVPVKLSGMFTCKTELAVHVLKCSCQLQYVGSTKLPVFNRILQHLRAIVNSDPNYLVARHFKLVHKNNLSNFSYFVIDAVPRSLRGGNREKRLRQLETEYILKLDTKMPKGLNTGEDLHNFL